MILIPGLTFLGLFCLVACMHINLIPDNEPVTIHSLNGLRNTPVDYVFHAPPNSKVATFCNLHVRDCQKARLDMDTGAGQSFHCEQGRARKFGNSSLAETMVLTMEHNGDFNKEGIVCQVWATTPFLNLKMEEVDSSEYGTFPGRVRTTCECGKSNKEDGGRIVGGEDTIANEFPFLAAIYMTGYDTPYCGGSVITANHILSAAHCFPSALDEDEILVKLGEHDVENDSGNEVTFYVDAITMHDSFDRKRFLNDIAIIKLEKSIEFNQFISRICLPTAPPTIGSYVRYMGWGVTSFRGNTSAISQKVDARLIDPAVCDVVFNVMSNENRQICTYGRGKDSCQGDSGGPLVWLDPQTNRYTQVGIVSFGRQCGSTDPAIVTNVYNYLNWINDVILESDDHTCSKVVS